MDPEKRIPALYPVHPVHPVKIPLLLLGCTGSESRSFAEIFPAEGCEQGKKKKRHLSAEDAARPAATKTGMGHRLTQIDTDMGKSSRKCAIPRDCSADERCETRRIRSCISNSGGLGHPSARHP